VDIVSNSKAVSRLWATGSLVKDALEVVLSDLDVGELVVVISVEVEVADDIAECLEHVLAGGIARGVGWAHVCGVFSDDVTDGHLVLDHLVVSLSIRDGTQILVRPGVAGHLVAFGDHAANNIRPLCGRVNCALSKVDASNEKGGLEAILGELVEDPVGIDVWSIVVGDSDGPWLLANVDALSTVRDVAFLRAGVIARARASRSLVGVAGRTVIDETVRGSAMVLGGTAVSCA